MDDEALRRALERAGFTAYQAEAYLTLLDLGTVPAVEVGHKSSVPVSHVYEVLRALEERGYVETIEREKLYAQPADPEAIREDLRSRSDLLADAATAVDDRYQQPEVMDHRVSVTKRADTALRHAGDLLAEADTVVEVAATVDQLRTLEPALRDAHDRGVVVRASVYADPDGAPLGEFDPEGVVSELRPCPLPGPLLVIIDRHRSCLAPNARWNEDYGVLIHDRILPFVFHWYFLTCLWNLNDPVYVENDGVSTYVSIEEFVQDFYDLWHDGYRLTVTVHGVDLATEAERTVTGTVENVHYSGMYAHDRGPTLADLAGVTAIDVAADGGLVRVGGWGAVFEDIEMRRLDLVGVERDALLD